MSRDNKYSINDAKDHEDDPSLVICELCKAFYNNSGWVSGTGGGISIRFNGHIYLAPSGVQKERMTPEDLFIMDEATKEYIKTPIKYNPSSCTPLFMAMYTIRSAGACIHTHSIYAVLAASLFDTEFHIRDVEQIKAMPKVGGGHLENTDTLVIPIIKNMPHEDQLEETIASTIRKYPGTVAVLVRNHGIFIWGETIWKAKVYTESIDYLLELTVKRKQMDPAWVPGEL